MIRDTRFENNMNTEMAWGRVFFLALLSSSVLANPVLRQIGISDDLKVVTVNGTQVCQVDGKYYQANDELPTQDPCEYCSCQPPGIACEIMKCQHKEGCRSLRRSGLCCPEYVCDCEVNGQVYQNGDRIIDHSNPCEDCYCATGMVLCSVIQCLSSPEEGCTPVPHEGKCCPDYECAEKALQESKLEDSEVSDITIAEGSFVENAEENKDDGIEKTTKISVLESDSTTEDREFSNTINEGVLIQSEPVDNTNVTHSENNTKSDDEDREISDYTTLTPIILENVVQTNEFDEENSLVDNEFIDNNDNYSDDAITTESPRYDIEREGVKGKSEAPDQVLGIDAFSDTSETEHTTKIFEEMKDEEADENTSIQVDKPKNILEEVIEETTENNLLETTPNTEEIASVEEKNIVTDKDHIASTQTPDDGKYEEKFLILFLEGRISQSGKENSTLAQDLQTVQTTESTDSNDQESQTERNILTNDELQEDKLEVKKSDEIQHESEISTIKLLEDQEIELTTENVIVKSSDEQESDHSATFIKQQEKGDMITEIPFTDYTEVTDVSLNNPEPEIENRVYRSDIEELTNKLIIGIREENTTPFNEQNFETTERADGYQLTTEDSPSYLSKDEEHLETSLFIATILPGSDSNPQEDLTTIANDVLVEIPTTLSPGEKKTYEEHEYWIKMMANSSDVSKNVQEDDGKSVEEETHSKREEITTENSLIEQDFTRLFLRSDLLFSEENATTGTDDFDQLVTTEKISKKQEEDEATTVFTPDDLKLNTGLYQDVKEDSLDEAVPMELSTQATVTNENQITTESSFDSKFRFDDINLEPEITTQVTLSTKVEDSEAVTEVTTDTNTIDGEDEIGVSESESLNEKSSTENDTKTESILPESTETSNSTEEALKISDTDRTTETATTTNPSAEEDAEEPDNDEKNRNSTQKDQVEATKLEGVATKTVTSVSLPELSRPKKPERIEQKLLYLAKKFGKLGLRPVLRRRAKETAKPRRRVNRDRFRKQFFKRF